MGWQVERNARKKAPCSFRGFSPPKSRSQEREVKKVGCRLQKKYMTGENPIMRHFPSHYGVTRLSAGFLDHFAQISKSWRKKLAKKGGREKVWNKNCSDLKWRDETFPSLFPSPRGVWQTNNEKSLLLLLRAPLLLIKSRLSPSCRFGSRLLFYPQFCPCCPNRDMNEPFWICGSHMRQIWKLFWVKRGPRCWVLKLKQVQSPGVRTQNEKCFRLFPTSFYPFYAGM